MNKIANRPKLKSAINRGKNYGLKVVKEKRFWTGQDKIDHIVDLSPCESGQVIGFMLEYYFRSLLDQMSNSKMKKVYYQASYDFMTNCGSAVEIKSHRDKHGVFDLGCLSCLYHIQGVDKQLNEMILSSKPFMLIVFLYKDPPVCLVQDFSIIKYHSAQVILGKGEENVFLRFDGEDLERLTSVNKDSLFWGKTVSEFILNALNEDQVNHG